METSVGKEWWWRIGVEKERNVLREIILNEQQLGVYWVEGKVKSVVLVSQWSTVF